MDDDLIFAIKLIATEHDIFDDDSVNRLVELFNESESADIDELLENNFDFECYDEMEYSFGSRNYMDAVNDLIIYNNTEIIELINTNARRLLQQQVTPAPPPTNIFGGFMNMGSWISSSLLPDNNIYGMLNNVFNDNVKVTLTKNALDQLKDLTFDEIKNEIEKDEACTICFSNLENNREGEKYVLLPCKHVFHSQCIKEYLKEYNHHCPICREECGESAPKLD
jgi:hypothetical protein